MENRIAYLIVKVDKSESYLYTDIRRANKKVKDLIGDCLFYEFRKTNEDWEELYQKINNNYVQIIDAIDSRYTEEYLQIMRFLKDAEWNSSIDYPENGLHDCEYCGKEVWMSEIFECIECGEEACYNCKNLDVSINYDIDIHTDHRYECDGDVEYCEDQLCYNNNCERWNPADHDGFTKSSYDEGREFIMNLDPDDPADAWFFED